MYLGGEGQRVARLVYELRERSFADYANLVRVTAPSDLERVCGTRDNEELRVALPVPEAFSVAARSGLLRISEWPAETSANTFGYEFVDRSVKATARLRSLPSATAIVAGDEYLDSIVRAWPTTFSIGFRKISGYGPDDYRAVADLSLQLGQHFEDRGIPFLLLHTAQENGTPVIYVTRSAHAGLQRKSA